MYNHILVPLDGSELAEQVLAHVEALAEKFDSAITLLRIVVPYTASMVSMPIGMPLAPPVDAYTVSAIEDTIEVGQQAAQDYLQSVTERLSANGRQVAQEVREGPIATTIIERANAAGANLIAMTTHGRSGLERVILGSVAEEVLRKSNCPVLLVRVAST